MKKEYDSNLKEVLAAKNIDYIGTINNNIHRIRCSKCDTEQDINNLNYVCSRCESINLLKLESEKKIDELNRYLSSNNLNLIVIPGYYKGTKCKYLTFDSELGFYNFNNSYENIKRIKKSPNKYSNSIKRHESALESSVRQFLLSSGLDTDISKNFHYKTNFKFKDCRDKQPLSWDFVIYFFDSLVLALEVDSSLHYIYSKSPSMDPIEKSASLDVRKRRDSIKDKYSLMNSIPFLRLIDTKYRKTSPAQNPIQIGNCYFQIQLVGTHKTFDKCLTQLNLMQKEYPFLNLKELINALDSNKDYSIY